MKQIAAGIPDEKKGTASSVPEYDVEKKQMRRTGIGCAKNRRNGFLRHHREGEH